MRNRWQNEAGISDLSLAIDEIYFLRAVLADEAGIIEAHLGYKSFPKSRRVHAEGQVERMRRIARGEMYEAARDKFKAGWALRSADADDCLTNHMWASQRGLTTSGTSPQPIPERRSEAPLKAQEEGA